MVGGRIRRRREEWERRVDPACECSEGVVGESRMREMDGWMDGTEELAVSDRRRP